MAIGTGAAIALGAATVGQAFFGNKAAGSAARAQREASAEALKYQRERDILEGTRDKRAWDDYQKRYSDWDAARRAIFAKHGIAFPGGSGAPAGGPDVRGGPAGPRRTLGSGDDMGDLPSTIPTPGMMGNGGMGGAPGMMSSAQGPSRRTLGEADWSDWRPYLGTA